MEKDFHYYLTYTLAKTTGFNDADIIAYASQYVDDNNEGAYFIDGEESNFPEKIPSDGGHYYPIMTQSLSTQSLNSYVQKYVYVPFHFLPGDNNVTINGMRNRLSTTPNSQTAQEALKSNNPYRIGIALHTFADTWSHQNFTGLQEEWNSVYPWYNVFKSIVPNIGHAEAGHSPDVISEIWTDHRIKERVDNRKRAFEATKEIYKALRKKSDPSPTWREVEKDFRSIINCSDYDDRIAAMADFLQQKGLGPIPSYSKNEWIDAAVDKDKRTKKLSLKPDYETSHWHNFNQAAKYQFAFVLGAIKEL